MKQKTIVITILLILCIEISAQQHTISVQPGFFINLYKDEVTSPLNHWALSMGVILTYEFESDMNIHKVDISFTMGESRNSITGTKYLYRYVDPDTGDIIEDYYTRTKENMNITLNYTYNRKIFSGSTYSIWPGLQFCYTFNMQFSDFPTFNSYISIGPSLLQKFCFSDKDEIKASIGIPLLSFVVRPPYAGVDDQVLDMAFSNPLLLYTTGKLMTVNKYFSVNANIEYRRKFLPWLEGYIGLQTKYTYIAEPRPKWDYTLDLLPGINFTF